DRGRPTAARRTPGRPPRLRVALLVATVPPGTAPSPSGGPTPARGLGGFLLQGRPHPGLGNGPVEGTHRSEALGLAQRVAGIAPAPGPAPGPDHFPCLLGRPRAPRRGFREHTGGRNNRPRRGGRLGFFPGQVEGRSPPAGGRSGR